MLYSIRLRDYYTCIFDKFLSELQFGTEFYEPTLFGFLDNQSAPLQVFIYILCHLRHISGSTYRSSFYKHQLIVVCYHILGVTDLGAFDLCNTSS